MIAYGHASIRFDGREITLIPSLKNIERIGSPKEIIDTFKFISKGIFDHQSFLKSMHILECCLEKGSDEDLSELFGHLSPSYHGDRILFKRGLQNPNTALTLAAHLLMHGVCGKSAKVSKKEAKPVEEFNAAEYINIARRNFNLSYDEAKNMTMTEVLMMCQQSLDSEKGESEAPTPEEHKEAMDWLTEVNKRRQASQES